MTMHLIVPLIIVTDIIHAYVHMECILRTAYIAKVIDKQELQRDRAQRTGKKREGV